MAILTVILIILIIFVINYLSIKKKYKEDSSVVAASNMAWLQEVEPKYRLFKTYPPDWNQRRLYVQKRDNYQCQICSKTAYKSKAETKIAIDTKEHSMQTGMHVHHKKPLSSGGDNSLNNLITLCEACHEDQHPHMLRLKLAEYKMKARKARKQSNINYWNNLVSKTESRLLKARNIYNS